MIIDGDPKVIAAAFVKARGAMKATVQEDARGNFGKYATLAAIVKAITEPFAENGLAIVQEASIDDAGVCVETWLVHESGSIMRFTPLVMPLVDRKPQAIGSVITYARRYALGSICGLAPDDDDAQVAQDAEAKVQATRPKVVQPLSSLPSPNPKSVSNADDNPFWDDVEFTPPGKAKAPPATLPAGVEPATDEEHANVSMWMTPEDAHVWAVNVKSCKNIHEARNSYKKLVTEEFDGELTKSKLFAVNLAFYRKHAARIASQDATEASTAS